MITMTPIKLIMRKIASDELWALVRRNIGVSFIAGAIITAFAQEDKIRIIADEFARHQWWALHTAVVVAGLICIGIIFQKKRRHW